MSTGPALGKSRPPTAHRSGGRLRAALLTTVVTTALVAGCGGPAVTSSRLQKAVGVTFSRLFVLQQSELGHSAAPPDQWASCSRNGSGALTGAGSWTCIVHFPAGDGHIEPLAFDIEVQPAGCYTAAGPAAAVGPQLLKTARGTTITNPLFAFDGCFDTSGPS